MKNNRPAGFYLSIEDLNYLDHIMCLLSDFVNIILDQSIDELDESIESANKELIAEGENELY
jgi:hypothetical protein